MPLRIAIVSQAYHPAVGGVTEHVDGTSRALRARGHEVTIVTSRFADSGAAAAEARDGVRVARLGRNVVVPFNGAENNLTLGWNLQTTMRALYTPLGRSRFDVIYVILPLSTILLSLCIFD